MGAGASWEGWQTGLSRQKDHVSKGMGVAERFCAQAPSGGEKQGVTGKPTEQTRVKSWRHSKMPGLYPAEQEAQ